MDGVRRIAPIFPVSDLAEALAHYARLGFMTREYEGGGYGYVTRDSIEIHLTLVGDLDPAANTSAAYIWVEDADALAREWAAAGAQVHPPIDTDWRQREGSHVDPFGNLIRFGTPIGPRSANPRTE